MVKSGRGQGKNFPSALCAILWKPPSSFSGYTPVEHSISYNLVGERKGRGHLFGMTGL